MNVKRRTAYRTGMGVGVLVGLLLLLSLSLPAGATTMRPDRRCFDETGRCIDGAIRGYWEKHGGLAVFGYPTTDLQEETVVGEDGSVWTGPVQWFERDRLEDHGAQGVMAGRLGAQILDLQGTPWYTFPQVGSAPAGCLFFQVTAHSLCEPFKSYWERNGGLERFGYPVTEAHQGTVRTPTTSWTGTIQYFERRRMEHHTEHAGTPYEVLLGLLGNEVRSLQQGTACGAVISELRDAFARISFAKHMGCPTEVYRDLPAAIQNMERGQMIWVLYPGNKGRVYAVWTYTRYLATNDTWTSGMAECPDVKAPPGLYVPCRGFGKAWIDNPTIRDGLGYAFERQERAEKATVQTFQKGLLIWLHQADQVYALGPEEWHAQLVAR